MKRSEANVSANKFLSSERSLERRLVSIFAILAIASTALVLTQIYIAREHALTAAKATLSDFTAVTERVVATALQRIDDKLITMAAEIQAEPKSRMQKDYLQRLLLYSEALKDIPGIGFRMMDSEGFSIVGTHDVKNGSPGRKVNYSDRSYFREIQAGGKFALSEPVFSKTRNHWQLVIGRRLEDKQGRFLGIIAAAVDSAYLVRAKDIFRPGFGDVFTVYAGAGIPKVIARFPDDRGRIGAESPPNRHPSLDRIFKGEIHSGVWENVSPVDNQKRLSAMTRVDRFPVFIIAGRNFEAQLAPWKRESAFLLLGLAFAIFSVGFMLFRYIRGRRELTEHQVQLVKSSKLAVLGEMAGGIAHEINNPLTIVHYKAYRLRELTKRKTLDHTAVDEAAEVIERTTMRISNIAKGLKSIAREGNNDPFVDVAVSRVIEETLAMCRERFTNNGIEIVVNTPSTDVFIECRPGQVSQLLLNLLSNAFDALAQSEQKRVEINVVAHADTVEIKVADSGPGVPTAVEKRIFEPFFTTKEAGKGTGLGLSISRSIAASHNGDLYLESGRSRGACFVLRVPRIEAFPTLLTNEPTLEM